MKKIFAVLALGMTLMSAAFAIPTEVKNSLPVFPGSISDHGVKVVEVSDDAIIVEINGQMYVIKNK